MAAHHPWDSPGKNTGVGCHFLLPRVKVKSESEVASRVRLLVISWTAAHQAPPSVGFSRRECWSGLPLLCRAYSLVAVRGLLITVDSLAAEHRALVVVVHRFSCPHGTWDLLRSGIELFPELQGRFLTSGPQGKPGHLLS